MSTSKINPTYFGYIGSTKDALLIIQACLNNQLYTVPRRPHDRERSSLIQSGNVFVFIEERSGIKRWTDGVAWSPSRILGRFLVYRELDRQALNNKDKSRYNDKKKIKRKEDEVELQQQQHHHHHQQQQQQSPLQHPNNAIPNRSLVGSLVTSYAFKEYGLIKKTLSLTVNRIDSQHQQVQETIHLVSYYSAEDVLNGKLQRPCDSNSNLSKVQLSNELWNAVKESSLGGKIPIEDEAYYFMDQSNPNAIALGFNPAIHLQPQYQQHHHQHHQQQQQQHQQHQYNLPNPNLQLPHPNSNSNYSLPPPVQLQEQPQQQQPPQQQQQPQQHQPQAQQPSQLDLQNMPMFYQYPRYSPSISYQQSQVQQPQAPSALPQPSNHQASQSGSIPRRHGASGGSPISPSSPQIQSNTTGTNPAQYQKDYISPVLKDVNYNTMPSSQLLRPDYPTGNLPAGIPLSAGQGQAPGQVPGQGVGQIPGVQGGVGAIGNGNGQNGNRWFGYDENGYVGYQFGQNH